MLFKTKVLSKELINVLLISLLFSIAFISYSCNTKEDSQDEKYKKESERFRNENNEYEKNYREKSEVISKYKYLEKKKIRGKKSANDFADELNKLGFELYDKEESSPIYGFSGSESLLFRKQEGKFTIKITLTVRNDGDNFIVVE